MPQHLNLFENNIETIRQDNSHKDVIKRIVEGLLFSSSEPLSLQKIKEIVESEFVVRSKELLEIIYQLQKEYLKEQRAFQIDEIAGGFLLRTITEISPFVEKLHQSRKAEKLSKAAMEVLAIVAYRGPVTRNAIEAIRGVDCSGAIYSLLERQLIEIVGRLEVPGRPCQYGITKKFLKHFGLNDIKELTRENISI